MDVSCSDLEFFDLSNASKEEVEEIRAILQLSMSNGCVELPWETPLVDVSESNLDKIESEKTCESATSSNSSKPLGTIVGQALLYAPPHLPPLSATPPQNPDVLPPVEAFIPPTAASALGPHYPTPYLLSRTLPYLRAYPHLGMPLFTCTLPGSGDLTHVPSPYAQFMPITASPPHLEKALDVKEDEVRQKMRGSADRQFNRRNKKKHIGGGNYFSPDMGPTSNVYQESVVAEDQTNTGGDHLSSVPSSMSVVPVPVPPSTFAVTSGAIPLHGYPPGLHPLPYSQISGPQTPSTPVYYVPVFNHPPYSSYIPSPASAPMMLPVGVAGGIQPQSEFITTEGSDAIKSSETLVISSESTEKTSDSAANIKSDCEVVMVPKKQNRASDEIELVTPIKNMTLESNENVTECCSRGSSDTLTETITQSNPKACCDDLSENEKSHSTFRDSSRCWADLFKNRCSEVNGLDRRPSGAIDQLGTSEPNLNKDITNGKLYAVPNSEDSM